MNVGRPLVISHLLLIIFSYICLTVVFINDDFSVLYAATNSNSKLPLIYKITGVWGAHEGSLLLWMVILSSWTAAVALFAQHIPIQMFSRILGVLGLINAGFSSFILLTSNPFTRLLTPPLEGRDLNPVLQDPGLIIHPPMLYMGYVGFSVAFAFAIAGLLSGQTHTTWARWARPWTNIAWMFLTIGIVLGSWWAYYELGWGGWWFWDPVENASIMPWLIGTALIHSLAATEKRGALKAWTTFLAIFAFSLSLLGTFLVRSGVLTSVHSFATDPERGLYILMMLVVTIGGSFLLYAFRASDLKASVRFNTISRESGILLNNILLVVMTFSLLLGTLYPLFLDALGLGKISVGPPYFNAIFVPLFFILMISVAFGSALHWRNDNLKRLNKSYLMLLIVAVIFTLAILYYLFQAIKFSAFIALALATWLIFTSTREWGRRWWSKSNRIKAIRRISASTNGMLIAHIGIAVCAIGIALTSNYSIEKDVRAFPGSSHEIGEYQFTFDEVIDIQGPNYNARQASVTVSSDDFIKVLRPEKRQYFSQTMTFTEASIDPGFTRDIYVALGDELDDKGSWALRLYYKPFIRWIWLGGLLMALGALIAVTDKRYRRT